MSELVERVRRREGTRMRRILVVDDDPHIRLAIRAWLKRYGFKVSIADGGKLEQRAGNGGQSNDVPSQGSAKSTERLRQEAFSG
jgi:CheY-like chemotaxis protein